MTEKKSFRQQILQVREDAIVSSVNRLLAEKGFDAMTVDEVAADVGVAKASLYKHFASKEALAAAAMIRVLDRALAMIGDLEADARDADPAHALEQLQARGPLDDAGAAGRRNAFAAGAELEPARCADREQGLSGPADGRQRQARPLDRTRAGRRARSIPTLPGEVVLYTLFARACDPVLGLLKARAAVFATSRSSPCCCESASTGLAGR